jgi:hypothetical protein
LQANYFYSPHYQAHLPMHASKRKIICIRQN